MENILKNSGLKHIAENIFLNLDFENLEICGMINWSCRQIMDNPIFWLRKFVRKGVLSKENQKEWNRAIQSKMNSDMEKHILMYLKWNLKNNDSFNLEFIMIKNDWVFTIISGFFEAVIGFNNFNNSGI